MNHNERSVVAVLYFDDHDTVIEEKSVGNPNLSGLDSVSIEVYDEDNDSTPHFHIITKNTSSSERNKKSKIDSCISLTEAKYTNHGTHTSMLTNKQAKELDAFLRKRHDKYYKKYHVSLTYWEFACLLWDASNENRELSDNLKQPDYSKLNERKK